VPPKAAEGRTIDRRRQRALAVVALLVVATIFIAVQFSRLGDAVAPGGPDDPPRGVDLFFARDPGNAHGLLAYDWAGNRRGSIKLPTWVDVSRLRAAPDGSGFMLDARFPGDYAAYFDRLAQTVVETDDPTFTSQVWAADARSVCVISTTDAGVTLARRMLGFADRVVRIPLPDDLVGGPITIEACSSKSDTAVLQVQASDPSGNRESVVVRLKLSTGAVLNQGSVGPGAAVVSPDGALLAVAPNGTGSAAAQIYRTSDLAKPVAELPPGVVPSAFSGDDSLLLVGTGSAEAVEVLDWRSGKALWHRDVASPYGPWVVRPSGGDFAIQAGGVPGTQTIVVAHRTGQTTTVEFRDLIPS